METNKELFTTDKIAEYFLRNKEAFTEIEKICEGEFDCGISAKTRGGNRIVLFVKNADYSDVLVQIKKSGYYRVDKNNQQIVRNKELYLFVHNQYFKLKEEEAEKQANLFLETLNKQENIILFP